MMTVVRYQKRKHFGNYLFPFSIHLYIVINWLVFSFVTVPIAINEFRNKSLWADNDDYSLLKH